VIGVARPGPVYPKAHSYMGSKKVAAAGTLSRLSADTVDGMLRRMRIR
jgi:hypothetical protein